MQLTNRLEDNENMTATTSTAMTYEVTIQPSGRSFTVGPHETILAAAIRQGIGLPYGCRDGACGSCKCQKLGGDVQQGTHQEKALSSQEQAEGRILPCCAIPLSDVVIESRQVSAEGAHPIRKMPVRVSGLERLAPDVIRLTLQKPASEPMLFHAGQYIEFLLRDGLRRSYSMANAPHTLAEGAGLELHIRHMPGGAFTDKVFSELKERDILRIEGPFGSFYLRPNSDKPLIFLASGTGFAPIKAMLEHMLHHGDARPVTLYWGGRRPHDLYMSDWVTEHARRMPTLRYVPVVSDALAEDGWTGRIGFVHRSVLEDFPDLSGHQVYACGAPIVVESAQKDYAQAGLGADDFFSDAFISEADKLAPA